MEDELIQIWQSSPDEEQVKFEKSRLMIDMQSSLKRFAQLAKYGILAEQIGIFIGIPVFVFYVYFVPFMLSKIASILIVLWLIWYVFRLRRLKKLKPNSINVNYVDYLHESRTYIRTLKSLGDSAMYWYVLPVLSMVTLFVMGPIIEGALSGIKMIIVTTIVIGSGIGAYFYLKWVNKTVYVHRLEKLDELIETMEE